MQPNFSSKLLSNKTPEELENMEKGAKFLDFSFKKLIDQVEEIIDEENTVKMSEVSNTIKDILDKEDNKDMKIFQNAHPEVDIANLEFNLPICIQSGGKFTFDLSTESSDQNLTEDTITLNMCCEYAEV